MSALAWCTSTTTTPLSFTLTSSPWTSCSPPHTEPRLLTLASPNSSEFCCLSALMLQLNLLKQSSSEGLPQGACIDWLYWIWRGGGNMHIVDRDVWVMFIDQWMFRRHVIWQNIILVTGQHDSLNHVLNYSLWLLVQLSALFSAHFSSDVYIYKVLLFLNNWNGRDTTWN